MHSEKTEPIKFSILVPVYQVEPYIDACIQSVLRQTYTNWELILVDDGSQDNSGVLCDRYAAKYPQIRVYHKENRGLIHTRRYGIARATGAYYIFLDSDDTLQPEALQVIAGAIQKYRCDCVIYGYYRLWGNRQKKGSAKEKEQYMENRREIYRKCFMGGYNAIWRKAVKAEVFQGGKKDYSAYYHLQVGEDLLQSIEILQNSKSVVFLEEKLYNYRMNPNSIMQSIAYPQGYQPDFAIRQAALDFWNAQECLTAEDRAEYRGYSLRLLCAEICRICSTATSVRNQLRILREIQKTAYFHEITDAGYCKKRLGVGGRVISFFYLRGWYAPLIFPLGPLYKWLRRLLGNL